MFRGPAPSEVSPLLIKFVIDDMWFLNFMLSGFMMILYIYILTKLRYMPKLLSHVVDFWTDLNVRRVQESIQGWCTTIKRTRQTQTINFNWIQDVDQLRSVYWILGWELWLKFTDWEVQVENCGLRIAGSNYTIVKEITQNYAMRARLT